MIIKRMIIFTAIFYLCASISVANAGLGFLKVFISKKHANCPQAYPTEHAKFCTSFETAAQCYCHSFGVLASKCDDMEALYNRMIMVFDTQRSACEYQRDTSVQNCLDSWDCYRLGGHNSKGRLCQSTGTACNAKTRNTTALNHSS